MNDFLEKAILGPLRELGHQAVAGLSNLMGVVILILLGLVVGWLAKELVYRLLRALRFDRLCDRMGVGSEIGRLGIARSCSYMAGQVVQGMIILTFLLAGLNATRSQWTQNLVERFFLYLPHLLAALLILIVGALVSRFLGRSVLIAAVNAGMPSARLLASLTRIFVMALTAVAALEIALGLAAREMAHDFLRSHFRPKSETEVEDTMRHL
jgi:hypothetical protein